MKFFNDGSSSAWTPPGFPNHDPVKVPTPIGRSCLSCGRPFEEGDNGLFLPHVGETITEEPWHIQCLRASLGVEPDGKA